MNAVAVLPLVRFATFACAVAAAASAFVAYQPAADSLEGRIAAAQETLRSDEAAFAAAPAIEAERGRLTRRYARRFAQDAEAAFVADLASSAARNRVRLLSLGIAPPSGSNVPDEPSLGGVRERARMSVDLRGAYRDVLRAVAALSRGRALVRVEPFAVRRDANAVVATVPVAVYAPADR